MGNINTCTSYNTCSNTSSIMTCSFDPNSDKYIVNPIELNKIDILDNNKIGSYTILEELYPSLPSNSNSGCSKYLIYHSGSSRKYLMLCYKTMGSNYLSDKMNYQINQQIKLLKELENSPYYFEELIDIVKTKTCLYLILSYQKVTFYEKIIKTEKKSKGVENNLIIKNYFRDIVLAIKMLHERGICHLCLNPTTVVFCEVDNIKITDFSNALYAVDCNGKEVYLVEEDIKFYPKKNQTGIFSSYISPEIYRSVNNISNESSFQPFSGFSCDVYSLGCILYFMFTKKNPEKDQGRLNVLKELNVDENVIKMLKYIFVDNPEKRIGLKEIMKNKWFISDE